jgi:hypothetical protein
MKDTPPLPQQNINSDRSSHNSLDLIAIKSWPDESIFWLVSPRRNKC